ncbi:hypothetical protein [Archangium violaceum]|uniref:hypothetical protein n=1 Tax=Archangium violaceum TaxID=83451 RepID=UPI0006971D0D|nr:hypothetical protein [Archangium violaceum]
MAGLWLASAAGAAPPPLDLGPPDRIGVETREDMLTLSWSDTEERLRGSIRPAAPRAGEPLQINLQVGSFEGDDFEGPLILTLREEGATHGQSVTVKKDALHWQATFTPENDGPHLVDVSFRTTRHKVLHASFQVRESRLPLRLGWAVLGLGCLALLGYTVRGILKGERAEERPLPPDVSPTPAVETAPVPTADTSTAPAAEMPPALTTETPPAPTTESAPAVETVLDPAVETPVTERSARPGDDAPPAGERPATPVETGAQPPDSAAPSSTGEPPSST